jgi:hypothetical protein
MIEILKFEMVNKGALVARFTVKMHKWGGLNIRDCTLFESGAKRWITLPSKPYEVEGKKKYFSYLAYEDRAVDDKFREMILKEADAYMEKHAVPREQPKQNDDDGELPF